MPNKRMGPPKRMSKGMPPKGMHMMPGQKMPMKDAEMDEMHGKKMAPKRKK